jgi:hypothetical protein
MKKEPNSFKLKKVQAQALITIWNLDISARNCNVLSKQRRRESLIMALKFIFANHQIIFIRHFFYIFFTSVKTKSTMW